MRKLLLLALLLCKCLALVDVKVDLGTQIDGRGKNYITDDVIALATRNNYDYDDVGMEPGMKQRHYPEDRRNWRKKALLKNSDAEHKDWDDRRRQGDYNDNFRYFEDDNDSAYSNKKLRYEDIDKLNVALAGKSAENASPYMEKDLPPPPSDKKPRITSASCDRPHERYEACFAGCAAVTCDNPRDRLRPCYPFCEPGCVCVSPYVRDDRTHKCVLPDDCTRGLKGIPDIGDET